MRTPAQEASDSLLMTSRSVTELTLKMIWPSLPFLISLLDVYFRDTAKARELKSDGNYERFPEYKTGLSAQEQFMAEALENADTEKPRGEGWLHRKVREKVTRWYRSLTSDLD